MIHDGRGLIYDHQRLVLKKFSFSVGVVGKAVNIYVYQSRQFNGFWKVGLGRRQWLSRNAHSDSVLPRLMAI